MLKITFRALVTFFLVCSVLIVFFLQDFVREYYPDFSVVNISSGIVFLCGCFYAILERNIFIGILTLLFTMAIPWIVYWFRIYWQYECLF